MNRIGGFLRELAVVERAQPQPLCQRLEFLTDDARLHLADGSCEVPLEADRRAITQALRPVAHVVDPCLRRVTVESRHDRHELWAELLEDLGLYYPDMASISRALVPDRGPLKYHRIERTENQALIILTHGHDQLTRTVDLDAGQLPEALPVEIAYSLAPPDDRATHWGGPPARTGMLTTWLHRMLRRP